MKNNKCSIIKRREIVEIIFICSIKFCQGKEAKVLPKWSSRTFYLLKNLK